MSFGSQIHALLLLIYLEMSQEDSQRGKLTPQFWAHIGGFSPPPDLSSLILHCF